MLFSEMLQLKAEGCGQEAFPLLTHPQAPGSCCVGCIQPAWRKPLPRITDMRRWRCLSSQGLWLWQVEDICSVISALGMSLLQTPALQKALGTPRLKLRGARQRFRCTRMADVHWGQPDDPPLWWSLVQVRAAQKIQGQPAANPSGCLIL